MGKVHNYSAGPCILPQEVFKEAAEAVINFNDLDLSLLENQHFNFDKLQITPWDLKKAFSALSPPEDFIVTFRYFIAFLTGYLLLLYGLRSHISGLI